MIRLRWRRNSQNRYAVKRPARAAQRHSSSSVRARTEALKQSCIGARTRSRRRIDDRGKQIMRSKHPTRLKQSHRPAERLLIGTAPLPQPHADFRPADVRAIRLPQRSAAENTDVLRQRIRRLKPLHPPRREQHLQQATDQNQYRLHVKIPDRGFVLTAENRKTHRSPLNRPGHSERADHDIFGPNCFATILQS